MSQEIAAKSHIHKVLGGIGWEIRRMEIDLIAGTAVITAMRDDGLWIFARADSVGDAGRGSIEIFRRSETLGRQENLRPGNLAPLTPLITDDFVLRHRFPGARSMLRGLCSFWADNGNGPIAVGDIKKALISTVSGTL